MKISHFSIPVNNFKYSIMKKSFFVVLLSCFFVSSYACEICGCGVGNYYIGLLPQFKSRFIGLRYHFNKFNTRLTDDPTQFSKDIYQTVELWSGWNIGKRVQLLTLIPLNVNHQNSDEGISNLKGLGDIVLLMNYKLLDINSKNSHNKNVSQQLWLGGGLKLPTGKFEIEDNNPDVASMANMQLGSGSTDIMMNAMYNVRINKLAITSQANYKINSANKEGFLFGNKFSANSFISYAVSTKKTIICPNAGLLFEHTEESKIANNKVDLTGGTILQGALGIELGFNKMSIGMNMQLPLAQQFAENQTNQKVKSMLHISFVL